MTRDPVWESFLRGMAHRVANGSGWLLTLACGCLVLACGVEGPSREAFEAACAGVPGCAEPRFEESAATETIWRVLVVREASGRVRIERVQPVEVTAGTGVPLGRVAGSHVLAGLDREDVPVDGQMIIFPSTMRSETADPFVGGEEIDLGGREVDTIGYVRAEPEVVRLAVIDEAGREVATAEPPKRSAVLRSARPLAAGMSLAMVTPAWAEAADRGLAGVPPHCAHVKLLEGEADRWMARGISYENDVELLVPGPTQRAVIRGTLGLMTPLLCHGMSRLAIGYVDPEAVPDSVGVGGVVKQLSTGDLILINVAAADWEEEDLAGSEENRLRMMATLIHEAAHSTEALLNAEGSRPQGGNGKVFTGDWEPSSRAMAKETIDRVRLEKSLIQEWRRTQQSFIDHGWAHGYPANKQEKLIVKEWSAQQVAEGGFMSRYGSTYYADDIAEMTAWSYMGDLFRAAGIPEGRRQTEDFGCQQMSDHGEKDLPARYAALYTKLLFLKDLGMIAAEDAENCIGSNLGLPIDRPGFHVWQETMRLRSFDREVEAKIGTRRGRYLFEMTAEGEAEFADKSYPGTMRLVLELEDGSKPLEEVPWPRGIYQLSVGGKNGFQLRLDGAKSGDFNVHEGYVVVAEASNQRIAGSIFMRVAFRLHAPLPVPQTFDPPLMVRFLVEK